jgi:sec-independent protein translocase protein TatB
MFDIGWSELLVIAVVAIVVVGPKDLPKLMRSFGHYAGKLRRSASDFQRQFEEAMRESEVEEVRKAIERGKSERFDLNAPIDQPVMLPKPAGEPEPAPKPKRTGKRGPAKSNAAAKRGKAKTGRAS